MARCCYPCGDPTLLQWMGDRDAREALRSACLATSAVAGMLAQTSRVAVSVSRPGEQFLRVRGAQPGYDYTAHCTPAAPLHLYASKDDATDEVSLYISLRALAAHVRPGDVTFCDVRARRQQNGTMMCHTAAVVVWTA